MLTAPTFAVLPIAAPRPRLIQALKASPTLGFACSRQLDYPSENYKHTLTAEVNI